MGFLSKPKKYMKKLAADGEYYEALEYGKNIEKKYSKDADFLFIMGSIYYILGDANNSKNYFDRVLQKKPKDIEALLLNTNVHLVLNDKDKVIDLCNKILDLDPHHKDANEILDKLASE